MISWAGRSPRRAASATSWAVRELNILFREQGPFSGSHKALGLGSNGMSTGKCFEAAVVPTRANGTILIHCEMADFTG